MSIRKKNIRTDPVLVPMQILILNVEENSKLNNETLSSFRTATNLNPYNFFLNSPAPFLISKQNPSKIFRERVRKRNQVRGSLLRHLCRLHLQSRGPGGHADSGADVQLHLLIRAGMNVLNVKPAHERIILGRISFLFFFPGMTGFLFIVANILDFLHEMSSGK